MALLDMRLYPFSEVITAIHPGEYIVKGDISKRDIFGCIQAFQGFFGSPDGKGSKVTDLLRHLEYLRKKMCFIDDGREKATLQSFVC